MQRKQDGLVPIGDAVSVLDDGPVPTLRDDSPQAWPPLHRGRSGESVGRGQRSGPRPGLHGADDGAVLPHAHVPLGDIFILDCPENDKWLEVVFRSTCRL